MDNYAIFMYNAYTPKTLVLHNSVTKLQHIATFHLIKIPFGIISSAHRLYVYHIFMLNCEYKNNKCVICLYLSYNFVSWFFPSPFIDIIDIFLLHHLMVTSGSGSEVEGTSRHTHLGLKGGALYYLPSVIALSDPLLESAQGQDESENVPNRARALLR